MAKKKQLEMFSLPPNPEFEQFWAAYPLKVAKPEARKSFEIARANGIGFSQMLAAIGRYRAYLAKNSWLQPARPSTWLNQGRWDDELEAAPVVNDFTWKALRGTHVSKYQ